VKGVGSLRERGGSMLQETVSADSFSAIESIAGVRLSRIHRPALAASSERRTSCRSKQTR